MKAIMPDITRQSKLTGGEINMVFGRFLSQASDIVSIGQKKGVRPGGRTGRQRSDDLEREER
ncbi:hypothetical protein TALK_01540 [Thalassospira alkalitolerans]|uniref:Uncharacterized protein n=1 Tax=Thalassospira alkalitolerans TaxID=1293890 RepID=A0A1Y2LG47_9PROT|nr:hypothetical protein TALK_01540 [Thalassospira alkalitolerans]|tara:strand:+ start:12656 stop:12841 length:186 start_codon:yes stop_codon:yes gene_type:complete